MKSEVIYKPAIVTPVYPRLMSVVEKFSKDGSAVVLFTEFRVGFVVSSDFYPIGHSYDQWDMVQFEDFHGEVKLSN